MGPNTILQQKEQEEPLEEMAESSTGAGNTQDERRASCDARRKALNKNKILHRQEYVKEMQELTERVPQIAKAGTT